MKVQHLAATLVAALNLCSASLPGQQPSDTAARRQQRTLDSLMTVVRAMQLKLDSVARAGGAPAAPAVDELAALRAAAEAAAEAPSAVAVPPQARLGANAMNPEISVTGDIRAHYQTPLKQPGAQMNAFVPREFEFGFQSALDPFSTAKVFMSASEGAVSVEEAYLYFTALPGHVRVDVGQFRQTVGELNRWHLHALNTDEYPLVIRRYADNEGLTAPGASLYWPLPFSGKLGTYELTLQGTVGNNAVLFAGGNRPSVSAQLSGFWQLSRATIAQVTVSGVHGTNPDTSLTTNLGVASARFSWRPPAQGQSREFTMRGELWSLRRHFALAAPNAFDQNRLGGYVDASWKLNRKWIAGARADYVQSPDPGPLSHEWAASPTLTYWTSEFVFLRGQYERMRSTTNVANNRLTMQVVFAMGPHKHELF